MPSLNEKNPLDFFDNFKSQIGGKLLDDVLNTDAENKEITRTILAAPKQDQERVVNELNKSVDVMMRGLHHIAAWGAGRTVDHSFDEPVAAQSARNALAAATGKNEATLYKEWTVKKNGSSPAAKPAAKSSGKKAPAGYRR